MKYKFSTLILTGTLLLAPALATVAETEKIDGEVQAAEIRCKENVARWLAKPSDNSAFISGEYEKLADVYKEHGLIAPAATMYRKGISVRTDSKFNTDSDFIARLQIELAHCLIAQRKYSEAEEELQKAIAARSKLLTVDHIDFENTELELANCFRAENKCLQAEEIYMKLLASSEKLLAGSSIASHYAMEWLRDSRLTDVIDIFMRQNKWQAAEVLLQKLIPRYDTGDSTGPPHPEANVSSMAVAQTALAICYAKTGRSAAAEPLFESVIKTFEKNPNTDKARLAMMISAQAENFATLKKPIESEEAFKKSLKIWDQVKVIDDGDEAKTLDGYAVLLRQTQRIDQSKSVSLRASAIAAKNPRYRKLLPTTSAVMPTIEFAGEYVRDSITGKIIDWFN